MTASKWIEGQDVAKVTSGNPALTYGEARAHLQRVCTPGVNPRTYAYLWRGEYAGQIISVMSPERADQFAGDAQFFWTSGLTVLPIARG